MESHSKPLSLYEQFSQEQNALINVCEMVFDMHIFLFQAKYVGQASMSDEEDEVSQT